MDNIKFESMCKDVVVVFGTHDIILDANTTNVKQVERFAITTYGKETPKDEPMAKAHNISVLILDDNLCTQEGHDEIVQKIKEKYGDNLLCMFDENGRKL